MKKNNQSYENSSNINCIDLSNVSIEDAKKLGIIDGRKDSYFKVENDVVDHPELFDTDREFIAFIVLSRYCNNNQVAFPSLEKLAYNCRCKKRALINAINSLEKKGFINKVKRYNSKTKIYQSNLYTVNNVERFIEKEEKEKNSNVSECTTPPSVPECTTLMHSNAPYKEQHYKEQHYKSCMDDFEYFDNLFNKEFEIPFHHKNQKSIKKLLDKMDKNNVTQYLKHLYQEISLDKSVKNKSAVFSSRISDDIDIFTILFVEEFQLPYHNKNKKSIKELLKHQKESDVIIYLKETYKNIKENNDVKNVGALFTEKIAQGKRQINSKPKSSKEKEEKLRYLEKKEKERTKQESELRRKKELKEQLFKQYYLDSSIDNQKKIEQQVYQKYLKAAGVKVSSYSIETSFNHSKISFIQDYLLEKYSF